MAAAKEKKKVQITQFSAAKGTPEEKKKALEEALKRIEKDYGKGAVMRLGEQTALNVEAFSTGSLTLDLALGIGASPRAASWRSTAPKCQAKPRWRCMPLPPRSKAAATQPTSTWSMPLTHSRPQASA